MSHITKSAINKRIKHTGLSIVGNGDGYFYFVDADGWQFGDESVYVCHLNQMTMNQWIHEAERAKREGCRDR